MENLENQKVVTRFAPSPTGFMHVGGVRTALYAYLWAKKHQGEFILRIEDTDKEREVEGSIEHIIKSLKWLGIDWDKGVGKDGGENYIQSNRLATYRKYAEKLIEKGLAYPDPYTEEEVGVFREKAEAEKKPFLYREHRPENFDIWDGTKPLRFKTPEIKSYHWTDEVRGGLSAGPEALDDFILIKGDGYPTYNFAHIIDDLEMGVTHIMRADEFIASTPKFLSLYQALEILPPKFVTLPPILADGGKKKLSKRDGAKDILDYAGEGYLPETMINFLALLGWNPGGEKEIWTKEELVQVFDIKKIQVSGAQWNEEKLNWMNREHIKLLSKEEIEKNILAWLPENMQNKKLVPLIQERISKWGDVKEMVENRELSFFFEEVSVEETKLIYKNTTLEKIKNNLKEVLSILEKTKEEDFNQENLKNLLMDFSAQKDKFENRGEVLHPLRFSLSGMEKSPDPFIIMDILGKDESIKRIKKVL